MNKKTLHMLALLALLLSVLSVRGQEKRIALIIGNGAYSHMALEYPLNNASDISAKLEELGFETRTYSDLDQGAMKKVIDSFGRELDQYDMGLFYYSGLAVKAKGDNYLVPVDALPQTESEVEYQCVSAQRINAHMDEAGTAVNLIILDASADNVFERTWTRSVSGQGLAFMDAPAGSLIAYSTSPGRITSNGEGRNSLYTAALLRHIDTPGMSVEDLFKTIRSEVKDASDNKQIPWESTSLEKAFSFVDSRKGENNPGTLKQTEATHMAVPEPERSLQFTDPRDGQSYAWVRIGSQIWMAENLNYEIPDESWCYDNQIRNCQTFGRLYSYEGALTACPDGWHLPSDEEWKMLEVYIGMSRTDADIRGYIRGTIQGGRLKSTDDLWEPPNNGAINDVGFSALPGGWRDASGVYDSRYKWGFFWTSTVQFKDCAWSRIFLYDNSSIERFNTMRQWGFSVRCIRDETELLP